MRSIHRKLYEKYNFVKLYEYIELCNERNKNNIYNDKNLKGITNEGIFEDSRANVMGLNFSNYKIVRKENSHIIHQELI